jgi:signal transduction histidine kinase
MELHSKQSGASATSSKHSVFISARLKLTGIYVLILGFILIGFSTILYQSLQRNLVDASEENFAGIEYHHHFVQDTLATLENEIILIDLIILITSAGVSYVLAGYTLRPIQQYLQAQKNFSENASHELRTPLAVMKNDIEVLLRNTYPTKEHIHKTLNSNIEEIDRMSKMAEDLLVLARSENKAPTKEKFNISEIAQKITEKMRPIAERKGVTITLLSNNTLYVQGNVLEFERVLMNLIQNAIEHTPKDGSITIETTQEKTQVVIKISDTGSGIKKNDLPHIFERFYKGEGTSGNGLGLSIVKELVYQHGGSIDITSIEERGTTVTIKLPLFT